MNLDIVVQQGKTFSMVFRYASEPAVFKPITAISKGAPMTVTAAAHGMIDGWAAAVVGNIGMDEANAKTNPPRALDYNQITKIDANTVAFENIDSSLFSTYKSGGSLRYYTPVDLTGATAAFHIATREGPTGTDLLTLVSPTSIVIDNTLKTITVTATAAATALLSFTQPAVYELLLTIGGVVTQIARGAVELELGVA